MTIDEEKMADYTNMANYYDTIMTSGYYDYDLIVNRILHFQKGQNILEIGCGTGLILEKLSKTKKFHQVTGIDFTKAMLEIADKRLKDRDNVGLFHQNIVTLSLKINMTWLFLMVGYGILFLMITSHSWSVIFPVTPRIKKEWNNSLNIFIQEERCYWVYKGLIMIMKNPFLMS
ncbi:MAG: class I SAM-dependent methyltransferase [Thioploca sp.]|nr:class I SAM-dependent methyltransferase [Thioploca sp.]